MQKKKLIAAVLTAACAVMLLGDCGSSEALAAGSSDSDHPVITMNAPYRNMSMFYDLVKEKYPEVNLEITPYNGQDMTNYYRDMRKSGEMPDIYFSTIYFPGREDDEADFLDLSAYDFTGNYTQSRLREVTYNGAVYMLPLGYNALGITYNKTLLEENGWTLPQNFSDLEDLKEKCDEKGIVFCRDQLQYPGFGFQYLCNILDTGFLSTIDGIKWQNDFVKGDANVAGTPKMLEALQLLERWRDIGMLNADGTPNDDPATREQMVEGNTLFLIGNSNDLNHEEDASDEFRLMPYISESGDRNVFILNVSRYVGLNKELGEDKNEQKLEDALKVMDVLATTEGMEILDPTQNKSRLLPLNDAKVSEDSYYADVVDELDSGHTANFIYAGWENMIVLLGEKMTEFIEGNATLDDVAACFDENQHLLTDDSLTYYTTATEDIGLEDCARAVGIIFAQATDADAALISTNPWTYDPNVTDLNKDGVSGSIFPVNITDEQIVAILPTGWKGTIQTVTLTGKRIKELADSGYDFNGDGVTFPYVLVTKGGMELEDDTTYTIPICGATDAVKEEGNIQDSGVVGLEAAEDWFGQFETLSAEDIRWE